MPRTRRAVTKLSAQSKSNEFSKIFLSVLEAHRAQTEQRLIEAHVKCLGQIRSESAKSLAPHKIASMTIGEMRMKPGDWTGNITSMMKSNLDLTKSVHRKSRSSSCTNRSDYSTDKGYLTASTSNSSSSGSISNRSTRALTKGSRTVRRSRSLTAKNSERYKTPMGRAPPSTYGTVTPKVKPNTPQTILRMAKLGETAWSQQGSPLLTGSLFRQDRANVNIPLADGNVLSIQPNKGLRLSQIPTLDADTQLQLQTLRDNLNKICSNAHY